MEEEIIINPYDPILQDEVIQSMLLKLLAPEKEMINGIVGPDDYDLGSLYKEAAKPRRELVFFEVLRISNGKLSCLHALTSPSTWTLFTLRGLKHKLTIGTSDFRQLLLDHCKLKCHSKGPVTSFKAGIDRQLLLDHVVIDF